MGQFVVGGQKSMAVVDELDLLLPVATGVTHEGLAAFYTRIAAGIETGRKSVAGQQVQPAAILSHFLLSLSIHHVFPYMPAVDSVA